VRAQDSGLTTQDFRLLIRIPPMRRIFLLLSVLLLALARPAGAQGDSIKINTYDVDLVVGRDGTLDVTERLRVAFYGPWNGLNRDLSLQHNTAEGRRRKLRVEVLGVTDERGQPYRVEEETDDVWTRRIKIWARSPNNEERTLVIRYRVKNAIRFFFQKDAPRVGNLDELYWNVTGNDWTMPIDLVRARVILPDGVTPTQTAVYVGSEGSTSRDADLRTAAGIVTVANRRALQPGEGITVGVGWPAGAIASRPTPEQHDRAEAMRALLWWPLALPLVAFFFAFRAWRRRGRDPRSMPIAVGYEPPDGLTPAEMGTLVDHDCEMRDVTATVVDLAVRGYVGIEEREEKKLLGLISSTEYVFHRRRPRASWSELAQHERRFLEALFTSASRAEHPWEVIRAAMVDRRRDREEGGDEGGVADRSTATAVDGEPAESVRMSELENRFYASVPGIQEAVYDSLIRRGYYLHRPDKVVSNWLGAGAVIAFLSVFGAVFSAGFGWEWLNPLALGIGGAAAGIVVVAIGSQMAARTEAGARAREAALGFREFLDKVESDRYRRMVTSPELFERYLPHAMAFGVEARWAAAFDDLYREPPEWYSGGGRPGGFRASSFAGNMSSLSSRASSTMSSSPSSSGSGGGGSSGGGSGGGGGSGF